MANHHEEKNESDVLYLGMFLAGFLFLGGLLLGGLVGVITTLLLAPQSGKKTRKQIRRRGRDLRVRTIDTLEDGVDQVRAKAQQVTTSVHEQAEGLQQRGQDVVDHGKERLSVVVEAGKTAVHGS